MKFIDTSYFFEVDASGEEKRFRLFALEKGGERSEDEHPDDRFEGVQISAKDTNLLGETLCIGGSKNQPEFRTINLKHTYEKQGVYVTIKSPVVQRRTFSKTLYASYFVSPQSGEDVRSHIRASMQSVLKGGVLVAAVASPGTAFPAFSEMVHSHLAQQGVTVDGGIKLGLYTEKECSSWVAIETPKTAESEKAAGA